MILKFEEKQYLGYNKFNLFIRLFIAAGCFASYFSSDAADETTNLFLIIGIAIISISLLSFFVLHLKTQIQDHFLILDGFWTTRRIKVDLRNIKKVKKVKYSKILFNRPVYNLHIRGKVKYFTHGNYAVELEDMDGLKYRIGSQRCDELCNIIQEVINNYNT